MWRKLARPRIVVLTGASAGVGRATALAFARRGAHVALLARDPAALDDTAAQVRACGVRALPIALDVSDADAVEAAAARVEAELGPIDVWVNNAMLTVFGPMASLTPKEFARVTDVTYLGYVWGTMAALKRMSARNRGCIVQVGSALAYRAIPLQSAYCGAKHAIRGLYRRIALRTASRSQPRPSDDGANARIEYAAIRLGREPHAPRSAAGGARFSAGSRRARDRLGGNASSA
jgi:NAD(P)-dependent dehydrogenase (short-subunit alcohol dehydrogenase family)